MNFKSINLLYTRLSLILEIKRHKVPACRAIPHKTLHVILYDISTSCFYHWIVISFNCLSGNYASNIPVTCSILTSLLFACVCKMSIFSYTVLIPKEYTIKIERYENGETKWIKPKVAEGSNLNMNQLWISPWCNKPVIWGSLKVWMLPGQKLHSSYLNSCPQQISSKPVIRNHHHIRQFSFYFTALSAFFF